MINYSENIYGRKFTIITDHRPLFDLLKDEQGVSLTVKSRMKP